MLKIQAFTADALYPHIKSLIDVCSHVVLPEKQKVFAIEYGPITDGTLELKVNVEHAADSGNLVLILCMSNVSVPIRKRVYASTKVFDVAANEDELRKVIEWKLIDPILNYVAQYRK